MELNRMKIGAAIAARRKEKGLTQEQLAARLGVSAPAVASGRPTPPTRTSPCSARWPGRWAPAWTRCCNLRRP